MSIASLLQGALASGQPSSGQRPQTRTPMYFTSSLRTGRRTTESNFNNQGGANPNAVLFNEAAAFYGTLGYMPVIGMSVNPDSITFQQTKRWSKKDTRQGSVYFHFTNTLGQNNDILTIQFKGNTGNIDLRGSVGNPDLSDTQNAQGVDTGALQKFLCFHNLYLLTREPMLLNDGSENTFTIGYESALFPQIMFNGFFSKVLEFSEDGEHPNSRDYSFEFVVKESFPSLDQVLAQIIGLLNTPAAAPGGSGTTTSIPVVPAPAKTQVLFAQPQGAQIEAVPAPTTEEPSGFGDDIPV